MADTALDPEALRRDRQRYAGLLEQAEHEIAAWEERVDHLQQVISALDRLLALDDGEPTDGGDPGSLSSADADAPPEAVDDGDTTAPAPPAPAPPDPPAEPPTAESPAPPPAPAAAPAPPPPPTATPAAPEPVEPPAASAGEAPKGTDAIRLVLASDPGRSWTLADLLAALGSRGWLPTSRRPEEGVRISLKRLAERGGAVRTDDGRWRLPHDAQPVAAADNGAGADAPAEAEPPPSPRPAPSARPAPPPPPRATSFGRPVGGTVTEL